MAWPAPPISRRSRDPRPLLDGADAGARALCAGGGASPAVPARAPRAPPPAAGPHRRRATTRAPLLDTRGVGRGGDDSRPARRGPPAAVAGRHRGADDGDAHGRAHRGRPAGRRRHAPVLPPGPARPGAARARRGAAPLLHRHGDRAVAQLPGRPRAPAHPQHDRQRTHLRSVLPALSLGHLPHAPHASLHHRAAACSRRRMRAAPSPWAPHPSASW